MLTMIPHRPTDSPDPDNGRSEQFIQDLSGLRNLEVLNVSIVWPYPSLRTVWSAIDGMKRLDVLRIDGLTWPLEYFAKLVQNTRLRKLAIAAPYSYSTSPDLHIQTLDEVAFLGVYVNPVDFPKFSSNVGRLTLQMGSAWSLANLLSSDWLNVHFNHITRLDLLVPKWGDLGDTSATSRVTLPGGLAHLGLIATRKYQGSRREYLALKDFCAAVALGAAQIGEVQILSRQTCVDLARRHTVVLAQIIDALRPSQIILLDYEGKGFALP
ncbi:hypothetical protein ONZ45_g4718 [Pleurotus djamor]|nr:hypothetical protein ONZ45_g4718 [Pleurotus djamor]